MYMRRLLPAPVLLASSLSLCVACTGQIDGPNPRGGSAVPTPGGPGTGGSGNGGAGNVVAGGGGVAVDPNAAGPMPMLRLTNREYNNTVHDLLGDTTQPANQFASDIDPTFEFRRAGAVAVQDAELIRTAAETLAANAAPKLVNGMLLPCDPTATGESACAQQFITTFGQRAFRRPVTSD